MKYSCPFCYKTMPQGYVPSAWACCGEVGHAVVIPTCPKCGAESLDLPLKICSICGWSQSKTPITDKIIFDAGECPESRIIFLIKLLANKCKEFEIERADLLIALKGLLADITEYQTLNNLGGEDNHWQVIARAAIAKAER